MFTPEIPGNVRGILLNLYVHNAPMSCVSNNPWPNLKNNKLVIWKCQYILLSTTGKGHNDENVTVKTCL